MSYLAQGLMNGFNTGFGAVKDKKTLEKRLAEDTKRMKAQEDMMERRLQADAESARLDRQTARQNEIERNLRWTAEQQARASDPREQFARAEAEQKLQRLQNPPEPSGEDRLRQDIERIKLEKEHAALTGATPQPAPTAKIRQPFGPGGKGVAEFEAPVDQLPSIMGASPATSYRSPYARDIAALGKTIAAEQAQIDGGDKRSGFLNTRSRGDTVANAQRQRVQLIALELEDKVRAGVISQEEADAEADRLLSGMR
jgi:hypothetical protein